MDELQKFKNLCYELEAEVTELKSVGTPAHIYSKILEWMDEQTGRTGLEANHSFTDFRVHYEKLRKDAARLDWMEKSTPQFDWVTVKDDNDKIAMFVFTNNGTTEIDADGYTLRDAIDSAMTKTKGWYK